MQLQTTPPFWLPLLLGVVASYLLVFRLLCRFPMSQSFEDLQDHFVLAKEYGFLEEIIDSETQLNALEGVAF